MGMKEGPKGMPGNVRKDECVGKCVGKCVCVCLLTT